jgi:hypothetical protein
MIVKVFLVNNELEQWRDETERARLIERIRSLGEKDDIDQLQIYYGTSGQVLELAPYAHEKLARRLRELGYNDLAALVDPEREPDIVRRQKFADQIQGLGLYFAPKEPMGDTSK